MTLSFFAATLNCNFHVGNAMLRRRIVLKSSVLETSVVLVDLNNL